MSEETNRSDGDKPAVPSNPLLDDAVWCLAHVWSEMNTIRARDGVPRMFDGTKSSVSQEWWDELMGRCEAVIVAHTGKPAHCNPVLYSSNPTALETVHKTEDER